MLPRLLALAAASFLLACTLPRADFVEVSQRDEEPSEPAWDPSPPEPADGSRIDGLIQCPWLTGPLEIAWIWEDGWVEERREVGEDQVTARPELDACYSAAAEPEFDHRLAWYADGTMFFQAGGLDHDLWPAVMELTWQGEVEPTGGPSAGCLEALEAHGMQLPVVMMLELRSIDAG